jgi:hypothetical protein
MNGASTIIGADAVRVSRCRADGTPDYGNANGSFILCGGISKFEHDYVIQDGKDLYTEDAAGQACVNFKRQDRTKRLTFTLTMCRSDYRLDEILGTAALLKVGAVDVGRAVQVAQGCGGAQLQNGVIIELWSEQIDCDAPLAGAPYMRTAVSRAWLTPKGFTRENGVAMPVYSGFALPNPNFDDGPGGDLPALVGVPNWVLADYDDTALPICPAPLAYVAIPADS